MSFFSIPGNIKQQFLPFQINPNAKINEFNSTTDSLRTDGISPQLFTYKNNQADLNGGMAMLGFYPAIAFPKNAPDKNISTASHLFELNNDISYKLLYDSKSDAKNSLKIDDIISNIPGVSIREFLPDTRLDQCINMFKDLFAKMSQVIMQAKDIAKTSNSNDSLTNFNLLFKKIWNCAVFTIQYMTGYNQDASFVSDMFTRKEQSFLNRTGNSMIFTNDDSSLINYVEKFPYVLYYCLQSCTTTNIYEVPGICDGKIIAQSDGKAGWGDGSDLMGAGGFRASGFLNKLPIVGELANMVLGNIGINYMPWWNAESGSKVAAPEIIVKFDLFNDNVDRALANFIFVNTIIPGNKWIQYNMFQHSSNLYDVKIEGLNRLFACAASFNVTYDGVLRNPPQNFIDRLVDTHTSKNIEKEKFKRSIVENNLIKLPDVYHVEMSFKSLLPANFNNFLYAYSRNVNHLVKYRKHVYDPGAGELLGQALGMFADRIKKVWNSNAENASNAGMYSTKEFLKKKATLASASAETTARREALQKNLDSYENISFYDVDEYEKIKRDYEQALKEEEAAKEALQKL